MTSTPLLLGDAGRPLWGHWYAGGDDPAEPRPTVLVTGSWLTVQAQMAAGYAGALAARGLNAVTFDFSGFGESPGTPAQAELPARKVAELTAVAAQVARLSAVRGRLGQLAVCASAQYALTAIAEGARIRSFAAVAGWFHDTRSIAPFYGGDAGVAQRLDRAAEALRRYRDDGGLTLVPAYAPGDDRAAMSQELPYYADPGRGAVAGWRNEMAELSWTGWLGFDGLSPAPQVDVPSLFVHGDACVLPDNVTQLTRHLAGPVDVVWTDGEQTDFYDRPRWVEQATDAAAEHFRRTL